MKRKLLIFLPTLLFILIIFGLLIVSLQQKKEFELHSDIPKTIKFWSNDFVQNGFIPVEFTGQGKNISPSLYWSNLPKGTKSFVITVVNYDAPATFFKLMTIEHWVVFNINPDIKFVVRAVSRKQLTANGISLGKNITGKMVYWS